MFLWIIDVCHIKNEVIRLATGWTLTLLGLSTTTPIGWTQRSPSPLFAKPLCSFYEALHCWKVPNHDFDQEQLLYCWVSNAFIRFALLTLRSPLFLMSPWVVLEHEIAFSLRRWRDHFKECYFRTPPDSVKVWMRYCLWFHLFCRQIGQKLI